jgi:hypothetical protein
MSQCWALSLRFAKVRSADPGTGVCGVCRVNVEGELATLVVAVCGEVLRFG